MNVKADIQEKLYFLKCYTIIYYFYNAKLYFTFVADNLNDVLYVSSQ